MRNKICYLNESIFISNKTYYFMIDKKKYINKTKHFKSGFLWYSNYFKLLNNIDITIFIKSHFKTS